MLITRSIKSCAALGLRVLRRALWLLGRPSSAQEQFLIQFSRLSRRYRQTACHYRCKCATRPRTWNGTGGVPHPRTTTRRNDDDPQR